MQKFSGERVLGDQVSKELDAKSRSHITVSDFGYEMGTSYSIIEYEISPKYFLRTKPGEVALVTLMDPAS